MQISKRLLLAGGSLLALQACSVLTPSQLDTDATSFADAVATMAVTLEQVVPAAEATVLTQIESAATTIGQDASALNGLIPTGSPCTIVTGMVTAFQVFGPLVATYFPPAAPIVIVMEAASALIPGMLQAAGVCAVPPVAASRPRAASGPAMTPELARAYIAAHVRPRGSAYR